MSIKHLFKAVFILTIFAALTRTAGFLFRIYLSREMGAEILGVYTIALSIFGIMQTCVSSGIPLTISRSTSEDHARGKKRLGKTVSAGIIVSFTITIVLFIVFIICRPIFNHVMYGEQIYNIILLLFPAILFDGVYSSIRGNLWGRKRFFGVSVTEFIEQILRIAICVVLFSIPAFMGFKAESAALSLSIAVVLSSFVSWIFFAIDKQRLESPRGAFKPLIKTSTPITFVRIVGSLATPLISMILPMRLVAIGFSEASAVAQLGVVSGMVMPLLYLPGTVVSSLATALVPDLSALNVQKKYDTMFDQIKSTLMFTLIVSFLCVPLFIAVGKEVGVVIFNSLDAGKLLEKAAIAMVPLSLSGMSSAILNSLGLEVKSMKNYMFGAIFLFIALWFLPKYVGGGMSLVIGMGLCTGLASILNIIMIKKHVGKKFHLKKSVIFLTIFSVSCGVLGRFATNIFAPLMGTFFSAVCGGTFAIICFLILLDAFQFISFFKIFKSSQRAMIKTFARKKEKRFLSF